MNNWRKDLKVGDKVIMVIPRVYRRRIYTVERLTKTQIILKNTKTKFKIADAEAVGGVGIYSSYLIQATDAVIAEIKELDTRRKLYDRVELVSWKTLSTEKLTEVLDLVEG